MTPTIQVRMLRSDVVNGSVVNVGDVVGVDAETATYLLNLGAAEPIEPTIERAIRLPDETATLPANETP